MVTSRRAAFLATYHRRQTWSFPDSLIYYINKNPSSTYVYQKMIKSCKYFFIKNPILIIQRLRCRYKDNKWDAFVNEKIANFSSKIWVTSNLAIFNDSSTPDPIHLISVISRIHQCNVKRLYIWDQNIHFKDLKFLSLKCEIIHFSNVTVRDEGGSILSLERLVPVFLKCRSLDYWLDNNASSVIASTTVKELLRLQGFSDYDRVCFCGLPETFDINNFYGYIKKNKKTKIVLDFSDQLTESYKLRLQAIVNEILATKNLNFLPPFISFPGITQLSYSKLWKLYFQK